MPPHGLRSLAKHLWLVVLDFVAEKYLSSAAPTLYLARVRFAVFSVFDAQRRSDDEAHRAMCVRAA